MKDTQDQILSRATLLASFYASSRIGTSSITMTPASAAGLLLHTHRTARAAFEASERMPIDPVWVQASIYLREIAQGEAPDTLPPALAAGGSR